MDNQDLVRRINTELSKRNISKTQFYADCGITSGAYSQWNKNLTSPSRRTLKRIADYFGWSEEYLLTGQQKKPSDVQIGELTSENGLYELDKEQSRGFPRLRLYMSANSRNIRL